MFFECVSGVGLCVVPENFAEVVFTLGECFADFMLRDLLPLCLATVPCPHPSPSSPH